MSALSQERLEVRVSNETAPSGSAVQIKVFLATPKPILSGQLSLTLDPALFGEISHVAVLSAFGDASGEADVQGRRASLRFSSTAGGVGRMAGLPVAVIHAPLLATARPGASASVTVESNTRWRDSQGIEYMPLARPGTVTAGAGLSVRSVTPGGDIVPAGASLSVEGTGFTATTVAEIEGVPVASVSAESPTRLRISLAGPVVLTGKLLRLRDGASSTAHYSSQQELPVSPAPVWLTAGFTPLLPLQVSPAWIGPGGFGGAGSSIRNGALIQNPHLTPVEVTIRGVGMRGVIQGATSRTIPAGQTAVFDATDLSSGFSTQIFAAVPIRVATLNFDPMRGVSLSPTAPALPPLPSVSTYPSEIAWRWQTGTPAPEPGLIRVCSLGESFDYSISAETDSGGNWLLAPPAGHSSLASTSCIFAAGEPVAIRTDPAGLAPGVYTGRLLLRPSGANARTTTVPVTLEVSDQPYLSVSPASANFNHESGTSGAPQPATLQVTAGSAAAFTATASFESGGEWFSIQSTGETTPAQIRVIPNPAGLAIGNYSGSIEIRSPANRQTVRVSMSVFTRTIRTVIQPFPEVARFSWRRGTPAPDPLRIGFAPVVLPVSFTVQVDTPPGNWMTAYAIDGPGVPGIGVRVEPTNLADGVYRGSLTIRSTNPDIVAEPVRLPVEFSVWTTAPALTATPSSLEFAASPGMAPPPAKLSVATGSTSFGFTVSGGAGWIVPGAPPPLSPRVTPAEITVQANPSGLLPGVYTATLRVTAADGRFMDIPVKFTKTGVDLNPFGTPTIAAIVNGASQRVGPVSPGAIVTLLGYPLAPLDGGQPRILFDGVPATLLSASPAQINAIVPNEVAGKSSTVIEVEAPDAPSPVFGRSPAHSVPVVAAAPALFTLDATGGGQAAALNQDNSLNGPPTPATRGSAIQLFGTAGGSAMLPVSVTIGGQEAAVLYSGSSPGTPGLFQVNVTVPQTVTPGGAVPVLLKVGGATSPEGVTIAVR